MTTQLEFISNFRREIIDTSRRDTILRELEEREGTRFMEKAAAFILNHLSAYGPTSSETLTDKCIAAGIRPTIGDTRAFGPVYMRLSRKRKILKAGYCAREKGHGTSGGIIWRLP